MNMTHLSYLKDHLIQGNVVFPGPHTPKWDWPPRKKFIRIPFLF
ncbi:hypothetical protein QKW52_25455 [Bacillus sonorensis]|nr:hypothetical protein [Bacillus sonorensis]